MSPVRPAAVVVLAAGEGTRMKSATTPKVLHTLAGRGLVGELVEVRALPVLQELVECAFPRLPVQHRRCREHTVEIEQAGRDRIRQSHHLPDGTAVDRGFAEARANPAPDRPARGR